jgi:hypothetical protein
MTPWLRTVRWFGPLVSAIFILSPVLAHAASTAGGASLQIPPGARAEGMGRFFSAVANDAFAPWWNPAGLAFMKGWNAGLMHAQLVPDLASDVYFEYLGVSNYVTGWGGIAGTFTYLNYGESVATDEGSPDAIGTFSSFEFSPSIAMGTMVIPNFGIGLNLKLLHVNLAPEEFAGSGAGKGTTFAVDLGALYNWKKNVDSFFGSSPAVLESGVGVTLGNLGPDISLVDDRQSDPLPRNLKVGVSVGARVPQSYSALLGLALEKSLVFEDIPDTIAEKLSWTERNEVLLSGGMEFGILDLAFARLGYIYDDPGEIKGMTFGAGFHLKQFGFDFASIPQFRELDRVSKFSVIARFE